MHVALHVAVAQPRRLRHRRANVLAIVPLQVKSPAHCDVAKALRKRRQLIGKQEKTPAHCDVAKALRKRRQLIVTQEKIPAHCDVPKALRKRRQLIVIQVKIPAQCDVAKALRKSHQVIRIQVRVNLKFLDVLLLRGAIPAFQYTVLFVSVLNPCEHRGESQLVPSHCCAALA